MNFAARLPAEFPPDRMSGLERAAYISMLGFAAAPQFSIAASGILLGLSALLWLAVVIINRERIEVPRMFWPLAAYAGVTLVASLFSANRAISFADCKQLAPLCHRSDHLSAVSGRAQPDRRRPRDHRRRVQRCVRDRAVRNPGLRQRREARPGQPRALHDLLRSHHARGVHRRRARHVPPPGADLGGARPPGGPRRPGPDPQPERLGRRVRRYRHAVSSQGSPIRVPGGRVAAGRDGLAHRLRTGVSLRSVLFDAVAQGHLRR